MTVGLTIPDVPVVHPRESWVDPCYPITGPAQNLANVIQPVAHYSAAANTPDGDIGEFDYQIAPWLRAVNRDYWTNRRTDAPPKIICGRTLPGYAVGYLFAIDWLGGAWELRGFDIRAAANAPTNAWTAPLIFITDGATPASELAWATARAIGREFRRRSGRADFVNSFVPHKRLPGAATACCGAGITAQIDAGMSDLDLDDGGTMGALTALPEPLRAYDSRPGQPVDLEYTEVNGGLPRTRMQPGESRKIIVGLATQAMVNITAVGAGQGGYIAVSRTGELPKTSVVNYDAADIVESNSTLVALEGGAFYIHCVGSPADVMVDVTGRG